MILITRVANNEFIIGKYNEYFQLNKSKSEANPILFKINYSLYDLGRILNCNSKSGRLFYFVMCKAGIGQASHVEGLHR